MSPLMPLKQSKWATRTAGDPPYPGIVRRVVGAGFPGFCPGNPKVRGNLFFNPNPSLPHRIGKKAVRNSRMPLLDGTEP
jgi:hypothetical protein